MQEYQVVIIGAGIAGLTAANKLVECGVSDVVVLEAQEQPGGRIYTAYDWGFAVDCGSELIYGDKTPLWPYIKKLGIEVNKVDITRKYSAVDGRTLNEEIKEYFELEKVAHTTGTKNMSIAENLHRKARDSPAMKLTLRKISNDEAADPEYIDSAAYRDAYKSTSDSGDYYQIRGGFKTLVDGLSSTVEVQTGVAVSSITREKDYIVVSSEKVKYQAKAVIVTVSLGVLKAGVIQFTPALSSGRITAIRMLGMGDNAKLIFKFDNSKVVDDLLALPDGSLASVLYGPFSVSAWWRGAGNGAVLVGNVGGNEAAKAATLGQQAVMNRSLIELSRITGYMLKPHLVDSLFIHWKSNPFIRGSYSFTPTGIDKSAREALSKKEWDNLFFAGEAHAISGNHATVHGALESGESVAGQALSYLHKK